MTGSNPLQPVQPQRPPGSSAAAAASPTAADRGKYAGKRLGKFSIVGELGRGGMGVVLEARDTVLDRLVAIKLLPRSVAAEPESLQRFLREARAAAMLNHPHVVAVYEADQFNGQYYIVLELVRGGSLQDVLQTGPLGWNEATRVLADACRGLEVAHRAGLVHRDIKPANLMRAEDGTVKLADFGLVRPAESGGGSMTGKGHVLGTPQFMSPEQCRSELADRRSDVYAMGATYFSLLTGRLPYPGDAPLLVMNAHLWDPIPDPREIDPTIPEACSAIIRRAMAKDPDDRFSDAGELLAELESVLREAEQDAAAAALSWGLPKPTERNAARTTGTNQHRAGGRAKRLTVFRQRKVQVAAAVVSVLILLLVGWPFFSGAERTEPSRPAAGEGDSFAENSPSVALAHDAFRLPGMRRDEPRRMPDHESWSMDYPGISHVGMANSGEFLVVLTDEPRGQAPKESSGRVQVWRSDGKNLLDEPLAGRATCAAISRDSRRLAVGGVGGQGVLLWNTRNWQSEPAAVPEDGGDIDAVALSDDGRWLAFTTSTAGKGGGWELWDLTTHQQSRRTTATSGRRWRAIGLAPDDEPLVMTGGEGGSMELWPGLSLAESPRQFRMGVAVTTIEFSPRPGLLAVGAGRYFALWSYHRDKRDFATPETAGEIGCVDFSSTGRRVAWAAGASVKCLDVESKRPVATLNGFGGKVLSLAFTPDGTRLFTASAEGKLMLWSIQGNRP